MTLEKGVELTFKAAGSARLAASAEKNYACRLVDETAFVSHYQQCLLCFIATAMTFVPCITELSRILPSWLRSQTKYHRRIGGMQWGK